MIEIFKTLGMLFFGLLLLIPLVFSSSVFWPLDEMPPVITNVPLVINNTSVIDFDSGAVLENQTVIIDNKKSYLLYHPTQLIFQRK